MEINLVSLAVLAPVVKDGVIAAAAIVTACIAIYGVRVWKRDLVGKELYEVTKYLVYQSHIASRASNRLLLPISASEGKIFTADEVKHTTAGERWRLSESHAYRTRLVTYSKSLEDFSEALLKARVVMGSKVYKAFIPFQQSLGLPINEVDKYLSQLQDPFSYLLPDSIETANLQRFIYKESGDEGDKMIRVIADAREGAEKFLLPYLHRKSIRG